MRRNTVDREFQAIDLFVKAVFAFVVIGLVVGIVTFVMDASSPSWDRSGGVAVWTDPKTGCRYTQGETGMNPLIGPDGRPDCARRP